MFQLLFATCVILCFTVPDSSSYTHDITHNLPSVSARYPKCGLNLSKLSAATCFIKFYDKLNGKNFDPKNEVHCCADWEALACVKKISENDPECTKNVSMKFEINEKFEEKEENNVKNICDPYKINCPSAPKHDLETKFPQCFAKVKIELDRCKPISMDFSNAANNKLQCCNFWSMITCEKNVILAEPACKDAQKFANQTFITRKQSAIDKVCNPYIFACKDAPDLESKYPECFKKMELRQKECQPDNFDFRNANHDAKQCCSYWAMAECTRQKARTEVACKAVLGYIDYVWSSQNKILVKQYCNPNWFKCASSNPDQNDPNAPLRKKYPECFEKIDQAQKNCESKKNKDYSNAFNNKEQCCGYWAMVGCTRALAVMDNSCKPLNSFINKWFNTTNIYLIEKSCPPNKFKCGKNGTMSLIMKNTVILVIFCIFVHWVTYLP